MEVLFFLIPLSIMAASIAVLGFIWAVRGGQFDDLDSPSKRVIFDNEPRGEKQK